MPKSPTPAITRDPVRSLADRLLGFSRPRCWHEAERAVRVFERAERLDPATRTLIVTDRVRNLLGPVRSAAWSTKFKGLSCLPMAARPPSRSIVRISSLSVPQLIRGLAEEAESHGARSNWAAIRLAAATASGMELDARARRSAGTERVATRQSWAPTARRAGWRRLRVGPQATAPSDSGPGETPRRHGRATPYASGSSLTTPLFLLADSRVAERGVLGLIGEDGQETRRCLEQFLDKRHFTPLAFQGARIPIYEGWVPVERKLGQGRIYLVGDAAGQVKVSTVGAW